MLDNLNPAQIVAELDHYIIGQNAAKRAVAVAIRNRWRRQQLDPDMAHEVYPKNIVMMGPTGVGKTEIARRLANLTGAPFIKVEASKFTEVGYHGRDVESMVRDLLDHAMSLVRSEQAQLMEMKAAATVEARLLDLLLPASPTTTTVTSAYVASDDSAERQETVRQQLRDQLRSGALDSRDVEIDITTKPAAQVMFANMGLEQMDPDMANVFERLIPEQTRRRKITVSEARRILTEQETEKLLDTDKITADAVTCTEESGIIFLDEIDKIALPGTASGDGRGPDVSRMGVQRDLLPIVEGSAVNTRYGVVHTDHILFIAAGSFHSASVSDLMPELQGRFPIRVELSSLTTDDFVRILTEPSNALTKQQQALLAVEHLDVEFDDAAIVAIADLASVANASLENIGARRLMTIIEKLFEQINFDVTEMVASGQTRLTVTEQFVREEVSGIVEDPDLSKFVL